MRVPLIISGKPLGEIPSQTSAFAWATDIAATVLSFADVDKPTGRYAGKPVLPMTGKNLAPIVKGEVSRVYGDEDAVGYELTGHGVLFQGDYKLVRNLAPLGDGQWRLYNIVGDPGETSDLKEDMPERFQRMLSAYEQFEHENKVLRLKPGYTRQSQLVVNMLRERLGLGLMVGLLTILILIPFLIYVRSKRRG